MTEEELDALLEQVPEAPGPGPIDDAELAAYAAGRLDPAASTALEARLAKNADARALVVALAEGVPDTTRARAEAALPGRALARWVAAPILAAAAAIIVWFAWPADRLQLPDYTVEGPLGGVQDARSPTAPVAHPRFDENSRVRLVLRPAEAGTAPVVTVLVEGPDGVTAAPADAVQVDASGAVRFEAPARTLFKKPGEYVLHAVLGVAVEPGPIPTRRAEVADAGGRWFEAKLTYGGAP